MAWGWKVFALKPLPFFKMSTNISEIEKRINAICNEDPTSPTEGGTDWNLFLKYINMSQTEWQETYKWPSLYKEVNTMTSQSTGNVSISLPSDFRSFDGYLNIADGTNKLYSQIDPDTINQYDSDDHYFYVLGYPGAYNMIVNPMPVSGYSLSYSYWANAGSLASPTDVSMCPDPSYLVQRSVAYLWETRDDGRFVQAKNEAEKILARMLENELTRGRSYDNRVKSDNETRYGYVIGRD
jgi:hypothetical protein